ncbi:unnamed protein product, partial [Amoebophrya sp. A120]
PEPPPIDFRFIQTEAGAERWVSYILKTLAPENDGDEFEKILGGRNKNAFLSTEQEQEFRRLGRMTSHELQRAKQMSRQLWCTEVLLAFFGDEQIAQVDVERALWYGSNGRN